MEIGDAEGPFEHEDMFAEERARRQEASTLRTRVWAPGDVSAAMDFTRPRLSSEGAFTSAPGRVHPHEPDAGAGMVGTRPVTGCAPVTSAQETTP